MQTCLFEGYDKSLYVFKKHTWLCKFEKIPGQFPSPIVPVVDQVSFSFLFTGLAIPNSFALKGVSSLDTLALWGQPSSVLSTHKLNKNYSHPSLK